jgi:hypothetical protein
LKFAISNLDIFYISYDEPHADAFYEDINRKAPKPIKRVHGVKGFDLAHRTCAEESHSPRFVTIDGDNIVSASLFFQQLDDEDQKDLVFSFKARNAVNGLEYGNGGIKVWPRGLVLSVPTHENAEDEEASTDFCWTYRYMQVNQMMSVVYCNQSALQAFRSGYREGVKMSLIHGRKLASWPEARAQMYEPNFSRLMIWASVGADVENGWWAIYGARAGFADLWLGHNAWHGVKSLISDYDLFKTYFASNFAHHDAEYAAKAIGRRIGKELGVNMANLGPEQSEWFKTVYLNPARSGIMLPQMAPVPFADE